MRSEFRGKDAIYTILDPALATASLFRAFKYGERPGGLVVEHNHDKTHFLFTCYEWLDVRDQSILLAIVGLAGLSRDLLDAENDSPIDRQLWPELHPSRDALGGRALKLTATCYQLLTAANLPTRTADYGRLKDSLYRLSQVGCRARRDGYDWSMRLLSVATAPNGEVVIALNSRFVHALFDGQFVKLCLKERRKLDGDPAKLLHAWLSATVRENSGWHWTGLDTVSQRVWGPMSAVPATQRFRRAQIRKALVEISEIGWGVKLRGEGIRSCFQIYRPRIRSD
ncbi:replication protein C, IncQ-type [Pseudomonas antarctica]|uniref:replication protein C, IncQ-type n=1 Tax=Pseudomonas antarctica TaxID=219572 RepID=UPI00387AB9D8